MRKLHLFFSFILMICFVACKKNNNPSTVVQVGPYSSMDDVFNLLSNKSKFVTIDAVSGGTFYGNSGTRYIFQPNSFQNTTGTSITGPVHVEVNEFLNKADMLFSKTLPVGDTATLLSAGEIYVNASQGGQNVYLKPGVTFTANIPQFGIPDPGMTLFTGQPDTLHKTSGVKWTQKLDTAGTGGGHIGIVYHSDTLGIISDSLTQCNADRFMTSPNFQTFTVTISIPGTKIDSNLIVFGYTLYDTYKGEWPLGRIGSFINGVYTEKHVPNIPVHFVAFTLLYGNFYGGIIGATPTTGYNYTVTLSKIVPTAFKSQVAAL